MHCVTVSLFGYCAITPQILIVDDRVEYPEQFSGLIEQPTIVSVDVWSQVKESIF